MLGSWEKERRAAENIKSNSIGGESRLIIRPFCKEQREAKDVWERSQNKRQHHIRPELKD